jgi:putative transposase
MPRKLRVEYPGAVYPVMSRGDRYENIFLDDVDRQDFLKTLTRVVLSTGGAAKAISCYQFAE